MVQLFHFFLQKSITILYELIYELQPLVIISRSSCQKGISSGIVLGRRLEVVGCINLTSFVKIYSTLVLQFF